MSAASQELVVWVVFKFRHSSNENPARATTTIRLLNNAQIGLHGLRTHYSHCSLKLTLIIVNFKVNFSDLAASIIIVKVNFSETKILHFSQNFLARFARLRNLDFPLISAF